LVSRRVNFLAEHAENQDFSYDVFISYSHDDASDLAVALQDGLERFARPSKKLRALRVFRDDASLATDPGLWASIERAMAASRWFILLASEAASKSYWVNREVSWWLANRSAARLLIVTTRSDLTWDERSRSWSAQAPVPPALRAATAEEPLTGHLAGAVRRAGQLRLPDDAVAGIAAAIHGTTKDALFGEHLRRGRVRRRLASSAITGLILLTAAALTAAAVAVRQRDDARTQARISLSRALVSEAAAVEGENPALARQLIAVAYRISPTAQAKGALLTALAIPGSIRVPPSISSPFGAAMAYSPDSRDLAIGIAGVVRIYEPSAGRLLSQIPAFRGEIGAVAFSPDGRLLAVGDGYGDDGMSLPGAIRMWDVSHRSRPRLLSTTRSPWAIGFLEFSHDGAELSSEGGGPGQPAHLWNVSDPYRPVSYWPSRGGRDLSGSLILSPGGRTVLNIGGKGLPTLWRQVSPGHIADPFVLAGTSGIGAFSGDGRMVAVQAGGGRISLWQLNHSGRPVARRVGVFDTGMATVNELAFAGSSGHRLLTIGTAASLWDVSHPADPVALGTLGPRGGPSTGDTMAVSPNGRALATCTDGGLVALWSLDQPTPSGSLATADAQTSAVVGDPAVPARRWTVMTTGDVGGRTILYLWDLSVPGVPKLLGRRYIGIGSNGIPAISPNGKMLAIGYNASLATSATQLWDISNARFPKLEHVIAGLGAQVLAFNPDSRTLVAGFMSPI
jgi:WD40 repeat protein